MDAEKVIIMTEDVDWKEVPRKKWEEMCEKNVPAQLYTGEGRDGWSPNHSWKTIWVKDSYGNFFCDMSMKKYQKFCKEGIPMCLKVDDQWVPNDAWKKYVYWD